MKVPNTTTRCDFDGRSFRTYGLVVLHDEHRNGKMDTNWLGTPREGYGFSNHATAAWGRPSFLTRVLSTTERALI